MITNFLLNAVLSHVGLSWIISSNKKNIYDIKENDHPDWLNKNSLYNTAIGSKIYGTLFDDFIINDRTYRCNIMCSITAHDKLKHTYVDDASSVGSIAIPKNATASALE